MEDCIFCKIASGEIHGLRIYENDETLVLENIPKGSRSDSNKVCINYGCRVA